MKNSKIWLIISINLFALFNTWHVESCAYFEPEWDLYRFFSPELSQTTHFRPLYFSFSRFYESEDIIKKNQNDENLVEWQNYLGNQATQKDLESIIYKSTQQDLDKIRNYILLQKPLNDKKWTENSVVQFWSSKKKDAEAIEYLIFAKKCEKYTYRENEWEEPPANANAILAGYSKEAEKASQTAKEPFFKLRYAYQAIRLAHYAQDYKRTLILYDKLVEPMQTENIIKYWALGHKAGALLNLGQAPMSAYLFSLVFEKSNAKRISSFLSCKVFSDEDWKKAISLCKNNQEKATLFFIRGIHPQNLVLPEMMAIYSLDPNSDYLDMLLLREINKVEMTLMPLRASQSGFEGYANSDQIALYKIYIPKLKNFIFQYLQTQKNPQKQALWLMALGYCDYLLEKPQEARKSFEKLNRNSLTPEGKKQIEVFETMVELMEMTFIDDNLEEKMYEKVKNTNNKALKGLMVATFERLYKKQKENVKAFLSYNDIYSIKTQNVEIDPLIRFVEKANPTNYEKELIQKIAPQNAKNVLLEIKATIALADDQLDEAEKLLKQAGIHTVLKGEPISDEIIDCVHCPRNKTYTKLNLIGQIKSLKAQADKGSPAQMAEAHLKLGNIYYNTTYYGHCWQAKGYFRSPYSQNNVLDCTQAQEHYEKAAELAEKSGSKELAAKATFLAAKAEQNQLFQSEDFKRLQQNFDPYNQLKGFFIPQYRNNFKNLKNKYRGTAFYNRAIKECYYFNFYTRL
ncbi:MAG: hypothetical protein OHK0045_07260 [Raineya sp.]